MQGIPEYIHFSTSPAEELNRSLSILEPDKVVVLVDENTHAHCLPLLQTDFNAVLKISSGETSKTLDTCSLLWQQMTDAGLSRRSVLVNLGGGVIGDMGGFVAATYKRGIRFINMPTTLLSQVDASIGGKLGVDFQGLKNHIGVFKDPDVVILSTVFLNTLSQRQLRSGFAEVIKHGLIWDQSYFEKVKSLSYPEGVNWGELLKRSVEIKGEVVLNDPLEHGLRKILNFGHTLGHAVETYHLENDLDLLHGEAIAIGMIMELHLSQQMGWLDTSMVSEVSSWLLSIYEPIQTIPSVDTLVELMTHDKKNASNRINFSILDAIGSCKYDVQPDRHMIEQAVNYYLEISAK